MSEETSNDTSCIMNQAANPEENCPQQCLPTDDATADELFDSFMEIANDPELHNEQEDTQNGTTGEAIAASDPSVSSQLKDSNEDEQRNTVSGTGDQEETKTSSDPSVSQPKDINSSSDELQADTQTETNEQSERIETDKESAPNGTPDHSETTVEESSDLAVSQVKDVNSSTDAEKVDSAGSNPATAQSNSDGSPVQNATEVPAEGSEKVLSNPVGDESKSVGLSVTTDTVQSSSDTKNEVDRTEELSRGTENLEKNSESSEIPAVGGNKEISPDPTEHAVECAISSDDKEELPSGNDESDVAKRLSKAMEDLAGLEQQLSTAVMELKQSTGENTFAEKGDEKELNAETQEGQTLETQPEGQVASQTNTTDTAETKVEDELVVNKVETNEGRNVPPVQETSDNATVCETDANLNDSNYKETLVENTDINNKDAIDDDCKGTDVDVVKVQEVEMENPESGKSDIPVPAKEDLKDESDVMGTSETPERDLNAGQEVGSKVPVGTVELQAETKVEESKNGEEKVSIDKSDSTDELDKEVVKCMSIPDIEITTDETENKSLDSLDTEGSSNSPPASPAFSDDGVDSDTPSDYGDDDDGTFEPDNLEASRRKSWLLEIDRDRLSSDSSTVSEKDFKDSFNKGDNADGKSPKEGEFC